MPVGKGSIVRATNASTNNKTMIMNTTKEMSDILTNIPIEQIIPVPQNWKNKKYQDQSIRELTTSIQKFGLIEPVILRRLNDNQFQLLSGYLRLEAVKKIGLETISSRILDGLSDEEAREIFNDLHKSFNEDSFNIHEAKFKVISSVSKDMPNYLL